MGNLIADILITTAGKNAARPELLRKTLRSLINNTNFDNCRLSIVQDGYWSEVEDVISEFDVWFSDKFICRENEGLAISLNAAFAFLDTKNQYFNDPRVGEPEKVSEMICFCQDDILFSKGWLERQYSLFKSLEKTHNLGVVSGITSPEHHVIKDLGNGLLLKNWLRQSQVMAPWRFFREIFPIPIFDPETQRKRARPNDGIGSGVDWHWSRNHERSLVKSGRNGLIISGQLQHAGFLESTWLDRALLETKEDLEKINGRS